MYCRSRARVNTLYAEYCRVDRVLQRRQSTAEYVDVEYCRVDRAVLRSTASGDVWLLCRLRTVQWQWAVQ